MAYCSLTDILEKIDEQELVDITDDEDAGVVDETRVARAVADADAEIDSYCAKAYKVPFAAVPSMIRKVSVAIAIYNLFQGRHGAPEDRKTDYDNAVRFLKSVSSGDVSLGVQPPPEAPDESPAAAQSYTRDKLFGSDTMEKF